MISDHVLVRFTLSVKKPLQGEEWVTHIEHGVNCYVSFFASDPTASKPCSDLDALSDSSVEQDMSARSSPTWLVKDMRRLLSPIICLLFNKSLTTCCFPREFKDAIVRPVPNKSGLDTSELKNYRPVSNLPFLSKLPEKVVQVRILAFFDRNGLMPKTQSAYRRFHSRETAVTVYCEI